MLQKCCNTPTIFSRQCSLPCFSRSRSTQHKSNNRKKKNSKVVVTNRRNKKNNSISNTLLCSCHTFTTSNRLHLAAQQLLSFRLASLDSSVRGQGKTKLSHYVLIHGRRLGIRHYAVTRCNKIGIVRKQRTKRQRRARVNWGLLDQTTNKEQNENAKMGKGKKKERQRKSETNYHWRNDNIMKRNGDKVHVSNQHEMCVHNNRRISARIQISRYLVINRDFLGVAFLTLTTLHTFTYTCCDVFGMCSMFYVIWCYVLYCPFCPLPSKQS